MQQRRLEFTAMLLVAVFTLACEPPLPHTPHEQSGATEHNAGAASWNGARIIVLQEPTIAMLGAYANANLPAYRTAAEVALPGAHDQSDDYRNANPQYFGVTVPPQAGRYRPYGEWETMGEVWTTYSSGMPGTPAVRRMFAEQTIAFIRHSKPVAKAYVIVNNTQLSADFGKAVDSYGISADEKKNLTYVVLPNQTIWLMDYSGFPLIDKTSGVVAFVDWNYYQPRHLDDALGVRIPHEAYGATVYRVAFPFEGGNFQSDGHSRCVTSNRALSNTGYTALKVRSMLQRYAGCESTYIVKDISDDGTGHIDMFFKWIDQDTVLLSEYRDAITADIDGDGKAELVPMPGKVAADYAQTFALNKQRMNENSALFAADTASNGKPYKVLRLPMMTRFKDQYGDVPRTFINSTFANGVNVYPSYATSSCQAATGTKCTTDAGCGSGQHCAAGRCTTGPAASGCDELVPCASGLVCKPDNLKIALTKLAQDEWQKAMPTTKHVGLRADTIALWSGAIHCITRTVPVAKAGKAFADGTCVQGNCGCSDGGSKGVCSDNAACFGPALLCNCSICKGTCSSGKQCTDDADCSSDGKTVPIGGCKFDAQQGCYGLAPLTGGSSGGGSCGDVSFEGSCSGKTLTYCDGGVKSQGCSGCCGWDSQSGYYNCVSGAACSGCVAECSPGSGGCSSQGTHRWACSVSTGCAKRVWTVCGGGCDAVTGDCKVGGGASSCPADAGGSDAGGSDAGGSDAGGSDADAGSGDGSNADAPPMPDTGPTDTGTPDVTATDTGRVDAGSVDTGSADTGSADTGSADTGSVDTGSADTGSVDTGSADTGSADTGSADTGESGGDGDASACSPACDGKTCGPDGCGGVCGVCQDGGVCGPAQFCVGGGSGDGGTARGDGEGGADSAVDAVAAPDGATTTTSGYYPPSGSTSRCSGGPSGASNTASARWLMAMAAALVLAWRRRTFALPSTAR